MKRSFKLAASVLATALMMSAVTSCYKLGGDTEVISEDDPWFNFSSIEIEAGDDPAEYEYIMSDFIAQFENYYVYETMGLRKLPEDVDFNNLDYMDYLVERIDFFNLDGSLNYSLNLSDYIVENDLGDYAYLNSVYKIDNYLRVDISAIDMSNYEQASYRCTIDMTDFTINEPESMDDYEFVDRMNEEGGSEEDTVYLENYTIRKYWMYEDEPSYVLEIIDLDDNVNEIDLRTELPDTPVYDISDIIDIGNDKALVCAVYNGDNVFLQIDFSDMSIKDITEDMSWFTCDTERICQVDGYGSVVMEDLGLYTIDIENQTVEPLFMYSDSNVNISTIRNFEPISVTEDQAVFAGTIYSEQGFGDVTTTLIYTFDRAETNPNAGKAVLTVAVIDDYTDAFCGAVCQFNETNEDYFIRYDDSYRLEDEMGSYDTDEEREIEEDRAMIAVGNRLSMDLVEGNGPDMIVNGASFGMLNNEDYLMDLSSYAQENLGSGEYFTSVIDAARVDGILYQLPLSFSITGISVPESDVEPGQIGFTYDQYREFVEGPCNGVNPISGGQLSLFVTALNTIQDLVITDNQVNYDTEAFRALAEYVLENVNDDLVYDDGEDDYSMGGDDGPCLVYVTDVRDYYSNVVDRDSVLLGVPSFDGRGPIIFGSDSIAVSADTDSEEGCLEFISLVMGAEAQEEFGMTNGIPVNRAAFDEVGARLIQAQNDELEDLLRYYSEDELRMYGYSASVMDEAAIDSLAGIIDTLTGWYTNDGAVNAIIREEMAAYFEGQKTLDQVIPVLQDRVQNVLNERAS